MQTLFHVWIRWAFATVCLCTMVNAAAAGGFTRECAARDMQILMQIEQSDDALSSEKSQNALIEMMRARLVCYEGHVLDALKLYDSISQDVVAKSSLSKVR